jgi:acyl-CoA synthetase (AMP-forming)/AMP-acid ligase II
MTSENNSAMPTQSIWQLLLWRANLSPDQLLFIEGDHKQLKCTVRECVDLAEKLAAGLYARGITAGTVVSWQMPTRMHTVILTLALARLGAVQNPILHLFRERELGDLLSQTQPEWLLVPPADDACDYPAQAQAVGNKLNIKVMAMDTWPQGDPETLPALQVSGDAIRWLFCTSGTTSGPKAVRHTDATLIAAGEALAASYGLGSDDVASIAYPFAHIGGLMMLNLLLKLGVPVVLMERFDIQKAAEAFRHHGVTMVGGSTAHYQAWLALQTQQGKEKVIPSLRMMSGGGASKPPQYYFESIEKLGVPILHSYGMTECPLIVSNTPDSSEHEMAYTDGKPVVGMEIEIRSADGTLANVGEEGEVMLRGKCLCKGYLKPEQNTDAFDDNGFYHTGDLGKFDEEGNLSLTGRLKDIIIRKGENISAREIEEFLMDYPNVTSVAVIGLPDEDRGERVCAVLEYSGDTISLKDISDYLTEKGLMKLKLPEQIERVEKMPRSEALGKVSKKLLKAQYAQSA